MTFSEETFFYVNVFIPNAFCRPRHGAIPEEREKNADRVSPLESALRGFADRDTEEVLAPAAGVTFDSIGAYDYYNLYSWERGFGIRYGKCRSNTKGARSMQEFLCSCSVSTNRIFFCVFFLCYIVALPNGIDKAG
jgi:hypothetical protein